MPSCSRPLFAILLVARHGTTHHNNNNNNNNNNSCSPRWNAEVRAALKAKDEEYIRLLKRQAADVDTLLAAMAEQTTALTSAAGDELAAVECALMQVCFSCIGHIIVSYTTRIAPHWSHMGGREYVC
jgi:hypothetical protein